LATTRIAGRYAWLIRTEGLERDGMPVQRKLKARGGDMPFSTGPVPTGFSTVDAWAHNPR